MVYQPFELIDKNGAIIYENFYEAFGYREGMNGQIAHAVFSGRVHCGGISVAAKAVANIKF